jgi:hypothetical protein
MLSRGDGEASQDATLSHLEILRLLRMTGTGPAAHSLSNVRIVIEEWIETARQLGRPIPAPRGRLMYA